MPVSGHTRYLVGFEYLGFNKETIFASLVALVGRMKSLGGFMDSVGNEYLDLVLEVVDLVSDVAVADALAFDLVVLAMLLNWCVLV